MLSDDSSSDSDTGIRFKTDSTRRPNASSDVDLIKNDRGRSDKRFNNERTNDSYNRNDSRSFRIRDRSPIRDDWSSRDRNRSDPHKSKSSSYNREKSNRENGNSDKYGSSSSRLRDEDKYAHDKRSEKPERISRGNKYESERGSHGSKDRLSVRDRGNIRINDEVVSNIRNAINRHLQPSKAEPKGEKLKIDRVSSASDEKRKSPKKSLKCNKEVVKERSKSLEKDETFIEKIYLSDDSKSSDAEPKPVSYYNMKSVTIDDQSDSSIGEDELRKEVLLLKQKLKHTKDKKKSKHKDKKKHKKSKSSKSESCTSSNSYNNSEDLPPKSAVLVDPIKKKQCEESNEEGEIVSDSDVSEDTKSDQDLKKLEMPDLREKLKAKTQDVVMGPSLPPRLEMVEENQDSQVEGPALPPHLMKSKKRQKNMGPTISEDHRKILEEALDINEISDNDDDVEIIGPLPAGCEEKWSNAHKNLEERALKLKIDSIEVQKPSESKADVREEWMLKLPEGKIASLGLGLISRQFRAKEGPDMTDRSSWTDDPQQKALKAAGIVVEDEETVRKKLEQNAVLDHIKKRDEEQEAEIKKHKKKNKRDTSLLDLHQKKLKKKKKKSDQDKDKQTRRPFDRDIDLKANRFDEAQKKAILKKAQLLDTRFSSGESKFL